MTTDEKLNMIVKECERMLALAEKRTAGEWEAFGDSQSGVYASEEGYDVAQCCGSKGRPFNAIGGVDASHQHDNAAFIASCAGAAEAGWISTIHAIECNQTLTHYALQNGDPIEAETLAGHAKYFIEFWYHLFTEEKS